ncbi:MAG: GTP 3',8-cyclase MoaA [Actinomycetota bacterium]|nr:GTP 3',8-cyclase MoaA [Actinomycetota bacterium]
MSELHDTYDRKIDYLRLSITDRCNLRCRYCMPEEGVAVKPHTDMMSYEEIIAFAHLAAKAGISRIRLTGGEPLVRKGVVELVSSLSAIEEIKEVSITTNGILLAQHAQDLFNAGLRRVNISIDSLDPLIYTKMTRWGQLDQALAGMDAALAVGMVPVKINAVVLKNVNDDLEPFAQLTMDYPVHVRFIEYMPAFYEEGHDNFISGEELEAKIFALGSVDKSESPGGAGPARYFKLAGAQGTLGLIGSSKGHFCESCNRLRLTADGKLRTCLFSDQEIDLLPALRGGSPQDLMNLIERALREKPKDRFARREGKINRKMSQIGG